MSESFCYYNDDGTVKSCFDITQRPLSDLRGSYLIGEKSAYNICSLEQATNNVEDNPIGHSYENECIKLENTGITALYNYCMGGGCFNVTASTEDYNSYRWCEYWVGMARKPGCYTYNASWYCIFSQPSTNVLVHTTLPAVIYIIGILLNLLILLVLLRQVEKSVINKLLVVLAVWDILFLACLVAEWGVYIYQWRLFGMIKDVGYAWLITACESTSNGDVSHILCQLAQAWRTIDMNVAGQTSAWEDIVNKPYIYMYWLHVTSQFFQMCSVYQTVIIAVFRFIAIYCPFKSQIYLTTNRARLASLSCLVMATLLQIPSIMGGVALLNSYLCYQNYDDELESYVEYKQCLMNTVNINPLYSDTVEMLKTCNDYNITEDFQYCIVNITTSEPYISHRQYFGTFFGIFHVVIYLTVFFMVLPFVLLLVVNIIMVRELWTSGHTDDAAIQENKAVTKVVVAIVTMFLISYIVKPFYIIDIYYFDGYIMNSIAFRSCSGYFTVSVIVIILPALNSVVNFLFYVSLRKSFREQFMDLFRFCRR